MKFKDIFKELIEDRDNGKYSQFCDETEIPKTTVSGWMNKEQLPRYEQLVKISKHFNVSADYLLGITDSENDFYGNENIKRYEAILSQAKRFNDSQLDLLEAYIELLKKNR